MLAWYAAWPWHVRRCAEWCGVAGKACRLPPVGHSLARVEWQLLKPKPSDEWTSFGAWLMIVPSFHPAAQQKLSRSCFCCSERMMRAAGWGMALLSTVGAAFSKHRQLRVRLFSTYEVYIIRVHVSCSRLPAVPKFSHLSVDATSVHQASSLCRETVVMGSCCADQCHCRVPKQRQRCGKHR